MIQRGGQVVLRMLDNVKQVTIQPLVEKFIKPGTLINTDEYDIYGRLTEWGYEHKSVCHSRGEYARDEDGDALPILAARGARQHDGRILVVVTELVTSAPRYFTGAFADLHRIFSICPQHPLTRQGITPVPRRSTRLRQSGTGIEPKIFVYPSRVH
jgi:hypothetical protein